MASLQTLDTVLYEVQQASIQMSQPSPLGVYDTADENALLMGSAVNLAGMMITDAFDWQQLRKDWLVTGDGLRAAWDLPSDFGRFVDFAEQPIDRVQPLTAQQWAANMQSSSHACRIKADQLQFKQALGVGETITFEYIDCNWVIDADDALILKSRATKNADRPRFDWLLMMLAIKVKWLEQKGMNTIAAQNDFNERFVQLTGHDTMGQVLTLSGPVRGAGRFIDNWANTPETGFGS
jgi:hypothetical protein